jgi:hypothetical protein
MDDGISIFFSKSELPSSRMFSMGDIDLMRLDSSNDDNCIPFAIECLRSKRIGVIAKSERAIYPLLSLEANITAIKPMVLIKISRRANESNASTAPSGMFLVESPISISTKAMMSEHSCSYGCAEADRAVLLTRESAIVCAVAVDCFCRLHVSVDPTTNVSVDEVASCILTTILTGCEDDEYSLLVSAGNTLVLDALCFIHYDLVGEYDFISFSEPTEATVEHTGEHSSWAEVLRLDVFLLIGQSNMAGRGKHPVFVENYETYSQTSAEGLELNHVLDENGTLRESYGSKIKKFDIPMREWVNCCDAFNLHKDVDILKKGSLGIGPGISFACHHLTSTAIDSTVRLGLIPGASGGTYLEEWSPDYINIYGNPLTITYNTAISESRAIGRPVCDKEGRLVFPANSEYSPGCINLLSASMRSLYLALRRAPLSVKVTFAGILWYQG